MLRHRENYSYEIVRHNCNTLFFATETVRAVKGLEEAQRAVDHLKRHLTAKEKAEGWSYYSQRTKRKPWKGEKRKYIQGKANS